jgi:hypothetical protein
MLASTLLFLTTVLSAQTPTNVFSLTDWSDADRSLEGAARSSDVAAQVRTLLASMEEGSESTLCGYVFHDFTDVGAYGLVITVDNSGRQFCNTVIVVGKGNGTYTSARVDSWETDDPAKLLQPINGQPVLIIPQSLSAYEGNRCIATVPRIFHWTGSSLQDVSNTAASASYFQQLRQGLQDKVDRLLLDKDQADALTCATIERDSVLNSLGIDPAAGLITAREWAASPDQSLRLKAVYVLDRLNTNDATAALVSLSHDRDPVVAASARARLARRRAPVWPKVGWLHPSSDSVPAC